MEKTDLQMQLIVSCENEENIDHIEKITKDLTDFLYEIEDLKWTPCRDDNFPENSKGTPIDWSPILILALSQAGQIWGVINAIIAWLMRDKSRTIELSVGENNLKLTGISRADQDKLVDWFKIQSGMRFDK
jgi:hypothetical protein